jgi:hypothetical protein
MALTEETVVGKIEIVGPYKSVQVRTDTIIMRDDVEISRSYHRHVIQPGEDYSNDDASVQAVCAALHTEEVIAAYQEYLAQPEI